MRSLWLGAVQALLLRDRSATLRADRAGLALVGLPSAPNPLWEAVRRAGAQAGRAGDAAYELELLEDLQHQVSGTPGPAPAGAPASAAVAPRDPVFPALSAYAAARALEQLSHGKQVAQELENVTSSMVSGESRIFRANFNADVLRASLDRNEAPPLPHATKGCALGAVGTCGRATLVFRAGLEGSGHHLFEQVFRREAARGKAALVSSAQWPKRALFELVMSPAKLFSTDRDRKWHYNEPAAEWTARREHANRTVIDALRKLPSGVHLLDFRSMWYPGKGPDGSAYSYPDTDFVGHGSQRPFNYPDLRALAQACEAAGVSLRVLAMVRNAKDTLISTVEERSFMPWDSEAVVLAHNAQVLTLQLASLDPSFVYCVDYDALPALGPRLRDFGPAFAGQVKAAFKPKAAKALEPDQERAAGLLEAALADLKHAARCGA